MALSKRKRRDVDTFVVLDVDRTLLDTDRLLELFYDYLRSASTSGTPVSETELTELKAAIDAQTGKQFDFLSFIEEYLGEKVDIESTIQQLLQRVQAGDMVTVMYEGIDALIESLGKKDAVGIGLCTYGSERTQKIKLAMLQTNSHRLAQLPAVIEHHNIATVTKPERAASDWYDHDIGAFDLTMFEGIGTAQRLVFIDDKLSNIPPMNVMDPHYRQEMLGMAVDNKPSSATTLAHLAKFIATHQCEALDVVAHKWNAHHTVENSTTP